MAVTRRRAPSAPAPSRGATKIVRNRTSKGPRQFEISPIERVRTPVVSPKAPPSKKRPVPTGTPKRLPRG